MFFFLEHQSTQDDLMSFRALKQVINAFQQYIDTAEEKGGKPKSFPFPIVVILYHGKRPWGKLKRMSDLIDSASEFAGDVLNFPLFLIDLSRQLKGHPALQALLEALLLASEGKLESGFDRVMTRLAAARGDRRATKWMGAFVTYALSICRIGQEIIYPSYLKILNEKEARKMATSTMQEIMLAGEVKGKAEAGRNMVLAVLRAKFGKVPKRIEEAVRQKNDPIVLESLAAQVVHSDTLDEFAEGL